MPRKTGSGTGSGYSAALVRQKMGLTNDQNRWDQVRADAREVADKVRSEMIEKSLITSETGWLDAKTKYGFLDFASKRMLDEVSIPPPNDRILSRKEYDEQRRKGNVEFRKFCEHKDNKDVIHFFVYEAWRAVTRKPTAGPSTSSTSEASREGDRPLGAGGTSFSASGTQASSATIAPRQDDVQGSVLGSGPTSVARVQSAPDTREEAHRRLTINDLLTSDETSR